MDGNKGVGVGVLEIRESKINGKKINKMQGKRRR